MSRTCTPPTAIEGRNGPPRATPATPPDKGLEAAERPEFTEAFRQAFVPGSALVLSDSQAGVDLVLTLRVEGFTVEADNVSVETPGTGDFPNVVLDLIGVDLAEAALARAKEVCTQALVIRCEPGKEDDIRAVACREGFRRHPREVLAVPYHRLDANRRKGYLFFERTSQHPPGTVDDPLYQSGRQADARLFHFEWASRFVRFNDRVLVLGENSGVGAEIIRKIRPGVRAVCVQPDGQTLQWERQAYANDRLSLRSALPDSSEEPFDCILVVGDAMPINPAEAGQRLNPGGRLLQVCSLGPHNGAALLKAWKQVPAPLYAETAWSLTGVTNPETPRRIVQSGVGTDAAIHLARGTDFLLLSAMRKPDLQRPEPFHEHVFPPPSNAAKVPNIIDFAGNYDNPWILHALVFACFRMADPVRLIAWLEELREISRPDSADRGAALCVLGYKRELPSARVDAVYFAEVEAFLAIRSDAAHIVRWQISLAFICARILRAAGEPEQSEAWFARCYRMPFLKFSPHHLSRTTEAAASAGRLAWLRGDTEAAQAHWRKGLQLLETYREAPMEDTLVNPEAPALFCRGDGIAEVIVGMDYAQHCAQGVRILHESTGAAASLSLQQKGFQRTVFNGY